MQCLLRSWRVISYTERIKKEILLKRKFLFSRENYEFAHIAILSEYPLETY